MTNIKLSTRFLSIIMTNIKHYSTKWNEIYKLPTLCFFFFKLTWLMILTYSVFPNFFFLSSRFDNINTFPHIFMFLLLFDHNGENMWRPGKKHPVPRYRTQIWFQDDWAMFPLKKIYIFLKIPRVKIFYLGNIHLFFFFFF